ncbi:hypothetical protein COOONC_06236 [Cooperia oncophora]
MSDMTTSTASVTTTTASVGRRKRFAETVVVTVVSDEPYDNSKNVFHLNRANDLSDIASSQGIKYSKEDVLQKIKNQAGNFAVEYTIMSDVDCYALRNFIVNAKKRTTHFSYATVECDDGEFVI